MAGWALQGHLRILAPRTPGFQSGVGSMIFFTGNRPGAPAGPFGPRGPVPVPPPTSVPFDPQIADANSGTFYSAMSNLDIEIGEGNPAATGVRFHMAQHAYLSHMDFRLGSALAGIYQVGNLGQRLRFFGGRYGILTEKTSPAWQYTLLDSEFEGQRSAAIREHEAGLVGIGTTPTFAIGERALLVQHPQGNVLWDCMSLIDDETVAGIERLGGLSAIAISHPHYYSTMVEWAERFNARVYLHEADRQWVMRPSERITFWSGETYALREGITLHRLGGHFAGGTVLHWQQGADGRGALLSGDIIQVVADRQWLSFMYSYH